MQHQATHARKDDGELNRVSLPLERITTVWRSLPGLRGGIGLRLLVRVLLLSLAITLLLTLMQLYLDYRRDVGAIDQRISEIDSGYRRSLGEGFWRLDARQLQLQADGILHLPDISYVELREATDHAAPLVVAAGLPQANPATRREFKIYYTNHGAQQLVGILVVEATFDRVYRQLFDTAAVILIGQAIETFIVSFFILLIVHRLITRHLTGIATSLRGYDLHGSQAPLRLDRRRPADELDRLVDAFNDMYARLQTAHCDLAEREARIRRLVDSNIIGIFIWDFDGRILEANDEFLRMVNYGREDLVAGRISWADLTPPDWRDPNNARIEQQKIGGRFEPFEKEFTGKDGRRVPILIGGATFEEDGNQGVAFVLDLTERKRGEERLRVQHTVALILAEAATIEQATPRILRAMGECLGWDVGVLWRVDREAGVLRCVELWHKASIEVPEFERVSREFSFVPGVGLPGRVWSSLEPEYVPDVVPDENFPRAPIAEREGLHAAFGFPILLGGEVLGVVECFSREIRQPDQELLDMLATIGSQIGQFIERKRAEEALRESEARFRDYAETASDWFCEMGPDYKFTLLSEKAFGSGAADRIGTACWDHALDLETESEKWRLLQEVVFSHKPFRDFVYRGVSSDGFPMYIRASGKPLFGANGEFQGYRGTCTDVTALRTAEAEARDNERRYREVQLELAHANRVATMGQLSASITHEVNQPITAAITYASAARRYLSAEPPNFREVEDALSLIVKEGNRAGEVVARIGALIKKAPARKDAVAINDAILEIIALARTEAANNSVSVRTLLAEDLPPVQGDRVQLQQVLLNLIINAIEAMGEVDEGARELLVSTSNEPDVVSVEVRDSGPGLAPAALERVFDAFYTTKPSGLGLGLSICRSIIEAHDGRLWASANVPCGAIFRFTVPAHAAATS